MVLLLMNGESYKFSIHDSLSLSNNLDGEGLVKDPVTVVFNLWFGSNGR